MTVLRTYSVRSDLEAKENSESEEEYSLKKCPEGLTDARRSQSGERNRTKDQSNSIELNRSIVVRLFR